MMFTITDQDGNETTEEATVAELRMSLTQAEVAMLLNTGRVAHSYNGGIRTFVRELDA